MTPAEAKTPTEGRNNQPDHSNRQTALLAVGDVAPRIRITSVNSTNSIKINIGRDPRINPAVGPSAQPPPIPPSLDPIDDSIELIGLVRRIWLKTRTIWAKYKPFLLALFATFGWTMAHIVPPKSPPPPTTNHRTATKPKKEMEIHAKSARADSGITRNEVAVPKKQDKLQNEPTPQTDIPKPFERHATPVPAAPAAGIKATDQKSARKHAIPREDRDHRPKSPGLQAPPRDALARNGEPLRLPLIEGLAELLTNILGLVAPHPQSMPGLIGLNES